MEKHKDHVATMVLKHSMKLFDKVQLITMDVSVNQVNIFIAINSDTINVLVC